MHAAAELLLRRYSLLTELSIHDVVDREAVVFEFFFFLFDCCASRFLLHRCSLT